MDIFKSSTASRGVTAVAVLLSNLTVLRNLTTVPAAAVTTNVTTTLNNLTTVPATAVQFQELTNLNASQCSFTTAFTQSGTAALSKLTTANTTSTTSTNTSTTTTLLLVSNLTTTTTTTTVAATATVNSLHCNGDTPDSNKYHKASRLLMLELAAQFCKEYYTGIVDQKGTTPRRLTDWPVPKGLTFNLKLHNNTDPERCNFFMNEVVNPSEF